MLWRMREVVPRRFATYVEPYVGGAAMLLDMTPKRAIIGDMNLELITCYKALAEDAQAVINAYENLWAHYNGIDERYYEIRARDRERTWPQGWSSAQRAARFLFICHTCFNGRYQVNKRGQCNTTWGRIVRRTDSGIEKIRAAGEYLAGLNGERVEIHLQDGVETLNMAGRGDFAFIDPPYIPLSKTAKFTEYTPGGFSFPQQMELLDAMERATRRGALWAYTNADRPMLHEYFKGHGYKTETVSMRRNMGGAPETRIAVGELLALNYDPGVAFG